MDVWKEGGGRREEGGGEDEVERVRGGEMGHMELALCSPVQWPRMRVRGEEMRHRMVATRGEMRMTDEGWDTGCQQLHGLT